MHGQSAVTIEDFQADTAGEYPSNWVFVASSGEVYEIAREMSDREWARVHNENGRKFLKTFTDGKALRISMRNEHEFDWTLDKHPWIEWQWRIHTYPEGGDETQRSRNDVAAAVYVTFGTDWLGRPRSIKYTFSSTQRVGITDQQGPLRVMVVDSAHEPRLGEWKTMRRNVKADYRQLFGADPPNDPLSITVWTDSDTIADQQSEADFDRIRLIP